VKPLKREGRSGKGKRQGGVKARRLAAVNGKAAPAGAARAVTAKTAASGGLDLLPEVLAYTSSLSRDRALLREDLLGSLAHLTMLARRGSVPQREAADIRRELCALWDASQSGEVELPDEEDVHMAVEGILRDRLGRAAGMLHSARSRNDQVALDLRLHVREQAALALEAAADLVEALIERASKHLYTTLPAYTHRQRAQPVSFAFFLCSHAAAFQRDFDALAFVLEQVDALPLGSGAIAGTSLPIDREIPRALLRFSRLTLNAEDTVGDRDFALDFAYATARALGHASRFCTDVIDFSSAEFGYLKLDGAIACGSSMMPQKRNPDLFELTRGKCGAAIGNLMALLTTVKGLPGGYNRDLQEDRGPLLATGPMLREALSALKLGLAHVEVDEARCRQAVTGDYMQATDLAEALVTEGLPFREAYQAVGALVHEAQQRKLPLAAAKPVGAQAIPPGFTESVLGGAVPDMARGRKQSAGGTAPGPVKQQIAELKREVQKARAAAHEVPRLGDLFGQVRKVTLGK
jgi:argininosuccinate lyase